MHINNAAFLHTVTLLVNIIFQNTMSRLLFRTVLFAGKCCTCFVLLSALAHHSSNDKALYNPRLTYLLVSCQQRYSTTVSSGADGVSWASSDLCYEDFWPTCLNPEEPDLRLVYFESFE